MTDNMSARLGDLDGDGTRDIVAVVNDNKSGLVWLKGKGDGFEAKVLDSKVLKARYVDLVDIDGDGDLDFAGENRNGKQLQWWENRSKKKGKKGKRKKK